MDEAWARCMTDGCGFEMVSAYADGDDHAEVGIVAGAARLHLEAHPDHTIEYGRESGESAAVWAVLVEHTRQEEIIASRAAMEEYRRRREERYCAEQAEIARQSARATVPPLRRLG